MKISIIGIGAMGCLFGSYLAPLSHVTLLGHWPEQVAALQTNGLTVIDTSGQTRQIALSVATDPNQLPPADLVIILVKSYQTEQAARLAANILAPKGIILTLQNGLGNVENITAVLPHIPVTLGITAQGATLIEPGLLRHAGHGPTYLAETAETAVCLQKVAHLLQQAGLETHLVADARGLAWGKLAINAAINPLTALLNVPNGFLAHNPTARKFMMATAREVTAVAHALAIQLPYLDAAAQALVVAKATAANFSSMCQDVRNGRLTEIDAICGQVVYYGQQTGVPTPLNQRLLTLIRSQPCTQPKQ